MILPLTEEGLVEPSVETMISELGGDQLKGKVLDYGDIAGEKKISRRISLEPDEEMQHEEKTEETKTADPIGIDQVDESDKEGK